MSGLCMVMPSRPRLRSWPCFSRGRTALTSCRGMAKPMPESYHSRPAASPSARGGAGGGGLEEGEQGGVVHGHELGVVALLVPGDGHEDGDRLVGEVERAGDDVAVRGHDKAGGRPDALANLRPGGPGADEVGP